jgi:hypothetical protein
LQLELQASVCLRSLGSRERSLNTLLERGKEQGEPDTQTLPPPESLRLQLELQASVCLRSLGSREGHLNTLLERGKEQRAQDAHVRARIRREKEKKLREIKRWEFPSKIGSHHNYVSPALEFSKFICTHIFGLDEAFHLEAHNVKMNLLRMIHCKEFSPEA